MGSSNFDVSAFVAALEFKQVKLAREACDARLAFEEAERLERVVRKIQTMAIDHDLPLDAIVSVLITRLGPKGE